MRSTPTCHFIHHHGGQVDGVYMCPHKPEDDCFCRKPKPGLLLQAAKELALDLQRSWMIGDAWSDVQAGQMAGVRQGNSVRNGTRQRTVITISSGNIPSHLIFDDLPLAFAAIFAIDNTQAIRCISLGGDEHLQAIGQLLLRSFGYRFDIVFDPLTIMCSSIR